MTNALSFYGHSSSHSEGLRAYPQHRSHLKTLPLIAVHHAQGLSDDLLIKTLVDDVFRTLVLFYVLNKI